MTTTPRTAPPTRPPPPTLTIRIDTREQDPFTFESVRMPILPFRTIRGTLPTGDYADNDRLTLSPEDQAVVERKSLADLYNTMGKGRDRFTRECVRMAEYGYAAIVIEASWEQIMAPNSIGMLRHPTKMLPKTVVLGLLALAQRYRIHVIPCPGRKFAEQLTHRILERWARDHQHDHQQQPNAQQ